MTDSILTTYAELTLTEFHKIASYIEDNVGIKMPETKKIMMQSRLLNRLKKLNFKTYKEYIDYVFKHDKNGEELVLMIDALTTNKTEFFREPDHFVYLQKQVLPQLINEGTRSIKLWSAGCSSGEEPYTLSIILKEYIRQFPNTITSFSVTGTDISTKVLDKATAAIYDMSTIENISADLKKRYFLKSKDSSKNIVKLKPEIRNCVTFKRLNFMDDDFMMNDMFQIIFCRNVLIYFDKKTQENVIRKLIKNLVPNGHIFLGHSETILAMDLPLKTVAPTVYQKIK